MDYKEKVIALLNSQELSKEQKEKLESIFPELAESEDERIRKAVIYVVNHADYSIIEKTDFLATQMTNWLEKQGEKKPIKKHDVCDFCDEKHGCVNTCPTKLIEEQKPADNVESTTQSYITPNQKFFQWIYDRLIYVHNENPNVDYMLSLKERIKDMQKPADKVDQHSLPISDNSSLPTFDESIYHPCTEEVYEQKPAAWSEENDQLILSDIIYYCKEARSLQTKRATFAPDVCIDWLKSLKDRVQPQLKQEWSEEDEKMLKDTIRFCELCGNQVSAHWLKNLRPQSQWRPSDEQMYNLSEAAHYNCAFFDMEILKGLYDDLKQLKDV